MNTEVITIPKSFFRSEGGKPFAGAFLDALENYHANNTGESSLDQRLAKLTPTKNLLKKPADYIKAVLKGSALIPAQIVTAINAQLRSEGRSEVATVSQVNGWMRLQGIKSEKKPLGLFHQDATGKISYIDEPTDDEATESAPVTEINTPKIKGK